MEETVHNPSQSSPFLNSNNYSLINPAKTHNFPFCPLLLFLAFLFLLSTPTTATTITSSNFLTYYSKHCNEFVPESPTSGAHMDFALGKDKILHFDIAYFTGGQPILPKLPAVDSQPSASLSFHPIRHTISPTHTPDLVSLKASLRFHLPVHSNLTWGRKLRRIRFRAPRIPVRPRFLEFELYGFWSMNTGKLCMVGSGSSSANLGDVSSSSVVLKLNHPVNFSDVSSLIIGVLETLEDKTSFSYFEPISILGIPHFGEYKYTLINRENGNVCSSGNDGVGGGENENLRLNLVDPSMCLTQLYRYARIFELEYGSDCGSDSGGKCNPLRESSAILPKYMTVQGISCEYGRAMRVLIGFSNSSYNGFGPFGYDRFFDPNIMLIGEGAWDEKKDRLCVVTCRVLNFKDSLANASVGDCSIQLSLRFPRTLTIRHRNTVVGQISSKKAVNDTGYFSRIGFHNSMNKVRGLPGLKYEYTMLDRVTKSCSNKKTMKGKGKTYPNGYSSDMRFDMSVRNGKGQIAQGYSSPLFVGDQLYEPYRMSNNHSGPLNMSYKMNFMTPSDFQLGDKLLSNELVEISAEGTYDNENGVLCMIGCWHLISHIEKSIKNDSVDCEILVNVQFSPINAKGGSNVKGTIESIREKSDPLYFVQLDMTSNSLYRSQAEESIWRMDIEITMVLISNTLACVFVGLQLYHVKKHPDVLPFISFVMLVILTLGHMIPLLLNFEALFRANHNRQNVFLESGGWLEVNEVAVRVVKMMAFLLQFHLLQLTWSARQSDGPPKSLWVSEKKVLYLSVPLYMGGGLIAWYVNQWKNSYRSPYLQPRHMGFQQHYRWSDLKSYAGLILDGFLLPQTMFNSFLNSKENALASPFYVGITIVRSLPHAYDLYRAHSSTQYLDLSYIYANHRHDFYSTVWDIIIPLGGLLFAVLIYLQQRFGGCCLVPKRFREASQYEEVPIVSSEDMQGETSH